jgi:transposase
MTQYKRIAIDTSKAVFTLHGIDHAERPTLRLNLRRGQMIDFFTRLPPTEIALEACGGGHLGPGTDRARPRGASDPAAVRDAVR